MSSRTLAPAGYPAIDWATRNMPLLADSISRDAPVFAGLHVGICIHIEPKTAVLCRWLLDQGARVTLTGNVGTTVAETADALGELGVTVIGHRADGADEHDGNLDRLLAAEPDIVMDNGGELIAKLTRGAPRSANFLGATEETTTGGIAVRALPVAPDFPVVVINDSQLKLVVENEHGVGQSIVQGFMNATNSMLPGARATVVGYGPCGKGVADTLRGLGAVVSVVDTDPFRALDAIMRGHLVGSLRSVLPGTELLFLATGARAVIDDEHIEFLRDGVIIAGVGHEGLELDHAALAGRTVDTVDLSAPGGDPDARVLHRLVDGREIITLHGTRMINLTAAGGNPIQAMDLGLSLQARSLAAIARGDVPWTGAGAVPDDIDRSLATALVAMLGRGGER
ncbi:adenosylhomocysteinase [Frigoribacterium sp. ACAM 257]|uniref:adenosylhomocysteinase n=1 Tax=Frigoribacterium sp. ACAM 257 TaxID=2508998 RepID=UPI0011BA30E8|nr:adenosylhomocysteinase [Frigoribacterium sp. ACAM 257]TWX38288.1 adenosylhomocysteinase [Frigoribacterium sp. ACAM 257]